MKPSPMDWRDPAVRRNQAMRDLSALSWAPRTANNLANLFAAAVVFGLLPVCFAIWMGWI